METEDLDAGGTGEAPRARTRKAALEALERLLRAHTTFSEHREPESPYGILRGATDTETELIEATFLHCGVPLPDSLRAIYRRTLGLGNPIAPIPVLTPPFLRALLPDEGFGPPLVGIEAFERDLGIYRDEFSGERPPFLHLGHAAPVGLTVSRNGLWSIQDYQGQSGPPKPEDFNLIFESAFSSFVDQVLLVWANDLAGAPLRARDLLVGSEGRVPDPPLEVWQARDLLIAARTLQPRSWGEIQPVDNLHLLHATRRPKDGEPTDLLTSHLAVVGLPFVDRPDLVARIAPGDLLRLRPVDDNPYDPQAVEVWHDGELSIRVGFVERKDAPRVRSLPPEPAGWRLRVTDRSDRVLIAALERITTEISDALADQLTREDHAAHDASQDLLSGASAESQATPARRRGTTQR